MKLSTLEALVAAMREQANVTKAVDPEVVFYVPMYDETNPEDLFEIGVASASVLSEHMATQNGDIAHIGDFAIPLRVRGEEFYTYRCRQADGTIFTRSGVWTYQEAEEDMRADMTLFTGCTEWEIIKVEPKQ